MKFQHQSRAITLLKMNENYCSIIQNCILSISSHLISVPKPWRSSGHHRWRCNNTFPSFPVFRCPQGISKPHSRPFLDVIFPSLLLSSSPSCSFTVPCRIVFAMPEDLEMWPYHLSFRFFTMARRSSCTPIAFWILLRTSSFVTWSL